MEKVIKGIWTYLTDEGVEIGTLGIDQNGKLYWNEEAIVTEPKIKLAGWVNTSIVIASISTAVIAIFTVLQFFCCNY